MTRGRWLLPGGRGRNLTFAEQLQFSSIRRQHLESPRVIVLPSRNIVGHLYGILK